ncbi:MAG: catechol 2,3-dioxygenase, partial [Sphingomonadales bacterium]
FVQIRVLDMEAALTHYCDRIGLFKVGQEADGRVYLHAMDEFDRHSVILREADEPGMDVMGFKVREDADLDRFRARLESIGMTVEDVPAGEQPGVGRRISFVAPTGHRFDLFADMEPCANGPMIQNPEICQMDPRGMEAQRFDHCLLYGDDLDGTVKVFTEALDFDVSETVTAPDGVRIAAFMTCSNKAHDLAIVRHPEKGKFHHASFLLEDWGQVGRAADLITRYNISLDIGPTRHGITRGKTIYFFDPSGNRNEVFAGGYHYYPDHPTRNWDAEEAGKAIFYYERQLNDRFMGVVT